MVVKSQLSGSLVGAICQSLWWACQNIFFSYCLPIHSPSSWRVRFVSYTTT